jgi:hypothetical protein
LQLGCRFRDPLVQLIDLPLHLSRRSGFLLRGSGGLLQLMA